MSYSYRNIPFLYFMLDNNVNLKLYHITNLEYSLSNTISEYTVEATTSRIDHIIQNPETVKITLISTANEYDGRLGDKNVNVMLFLQEMRNNRSMFGIADFPIGTKKPIFARNNTRSYTIQNLSSSWSREGGTSTGDTYKIVLDIRQVLVIGASPTVEEINEFQFTEEETSDILNRLTDVIPEQTSNRMFEGVIP